MTSPSQACEHALLGSGQAETKKDAGKAFGLFLKTYEAKYPKAALCLQKDREELMAFFDFRHSIGKVSAPVTR